MALRVTLSPGERLFVGTTTILVASAHTVTIIIDGESPVLREKDIVHPGASAGEAVQLCITLQTMYLTGDVAKMLPDYTSQARALLRVAPQAGRELAEVDAELRNGSIYKALKVARNLL
jgi:flagellar protein FlbT